MVVLGIDPGTAIMGYSFLDFGKGINVLDYGVLRTVAGEAPHLRLAQLFSGLENLIATYRPNSLAIESLFFNKNVTTAISVGEARGVALLAAARYGMTVSEYTPLQVKQAVTGQGRAAKEQVGYMVKALLHLAEIPTPDDACDAIAVALCHHYRNTGLAGKLKGGRL